MRLSAVFQAFAVLIALVMARSALAANCVVPASGAATIASCEVPVGVTQTYPGAVTMSGSVIVRGTLKTPSGLLSVNNAGNLVEVSGSIEAAALTITGTLSVQPNPSFSISTTGVMTVHGTLATSGTVGQMVAIYPNSFTMGGSGAVTVAGAGFLINAAGAIATSGSGINANGGGYAIATGPGYDGIGAAHGGFAGNNSGNLVASPQSAATNGQGSGGSGGAGGGYVVLDAGTSVSINGAIQANGGTTSCASTSNGGGAGGTIIIVARTTLTGAGTVSANGGSGCSAGRGGGGGRIIGNGNSATALTTATAYGGGGSAAWPGGAGTVWYSPFTGTDVLTIANNVNGADTRGSFSTASLRVLSFARLRITAADTVAFTTLTGSTSARITIDSDATMPAPTSMSGVDIVQYGNITGANTTFSSGTWYWHGEAATAATRARFAAGSAFNLTIGSSGVFEMSGTNELQLGTVIVNSSGAIRHALNTGATIDHTVKLRTATLTVSVSGSIHGNALGHPRQTGPGFDGTGAAHGGFAYQDKGNIVGDPNGPTLLGSGGMTGIGGGAVRLIVDGTFTLAGTISANAGPSIAGGASGSGAAGGSVWITASTVTGAGSIQASGGAGNASGGPGGGGGRILIEYGSGTGTHPGQPGRAFAYGGTNTTSFGGGAGVVIQTGGVSGKVGYFDNNTATVIAGRTAIVDTQSFDSVIVKRGARLAVIGTLNPGTLVGGSSSGGNEGGRLEVDPSGTVCVGGTAALSYFNVYQYGTWACGNITLATSDMNVDGATTVFTSAVTSISVNISARVQQRGLLPVKLKSLDITSDGQWYPIVNGATHDNQVNIEAENITLSGNSGIHAIAASPTGGPGQSNSGSAHGGLAWGERGVVYGSVEEPILPGTSGVVSGRGGDVIRVKVSDTLNLSGVSSYIQSTGSQCGTGGSVWVTTNKLSGSGSILALGGGCASYPGGGGRVALYYRTIVAGSIMLTGNRVRANGQNNLSAVGGAGTVFIAPVDAAGNVQQRNLLIDNLSLIGGVTQQLGANEIYDTVTIRNAARYVVMAGQSLTYTQSLVGGATNVAYRPLLTLDAAGTNPAAVLYSPTSTLALSNVDLMLFGVVDGVRDVVLTDSTLTYGGVFAAGLDTLDVGANGIFEQRGLDPLSLSTVTVRSTGIYRSGDNTTALANKVNLDVGALHLLSGGSITASAMSPTGTANAAGSSHGGLGGGGTGTVYGSVKTPDMAGIANTSGKGGGVVRIDADSFDLNGSVLADATVNGACGPAASGGSIWITSGSLSGTGILGARGGTNTCNGYNSGGGGRIAVYYASLDGASTLFNAGKALASVWNASSPNNIGSPGTVYVEKTGAAAKQTLIIDNNSVASTVTTPQVEASESYDVLTIRGYGRYSVGAGQILSISETLNGGPASTVARGLLSIKSGATFASPASALTVMDLDVEVFGTFATTTDLTLLRSTLVYAGDFAGPLAALTLDDTGIFEQRTQTPLSLTSLVVKNKGVYQCSANTTATKVYEVDLQADSIDVQTGGSINANGKGAPAGLGLGRKNNVAGHGGLGFSVNNGQTYGSVEQPTDLGSGGNAPGGGAIRIQSNSLVVNGTIGANAATNATSFGGSGGSVWLTTSALAGSGTISAHGWGISGNNEAGAGGRIALEYTTLAGGSTILNIGRIAAGNAGTTNNPAGAGTVFVKQLSSGKRTLIVDNAGFVGGRTPQMSASESYDEVIVRNGAHYTVASGQALAATTTLTGGTTRGTITLDGSLVAPAVSVVDGLDLNLNGSVSGVTDLSLARSTWVWVGSWAMPLGRVTIDTLGVLEQKKLAPLQVGQLIVQSSGNLKSGNNTSTTKQYQVWVEASDIDVLSPGTITANGAGAPAGSGPGFVSSLSGYGGRGQGEVGNVYGSAVMPEDLGSGGTGSNAGGGAIKLVVSHRLFISGSITATGGGATQGNGGSGGSVLLQTDIVAGNGTVSAIGNNGTFVVDQMSGGGRVAVHYKSLEAGATILNAGRITTASNTGGAGTVVLRKLADGATAERTLLRIDNSGNDGATTPIAQAVETYDDIELRSGAELIIPSGKQLVLASDGVVTGQVGAGRTPTWLVVAGGRVSLPTRTTLEGLTLTHQGEIDQVRELVIKAATIFYDEAQVRHALGVLTVAGTYEKRGKSQLVVEGPIVVQSGGLFTHAANGTSYTNNLDVKAISLEVQNNGKVVADGKGFTEGSGPGAGGAGTTSGGAGHRGAGGQSSGAIAVGGGVYSDAVALLGSGGGDENGSGAVGIGGAGGGAILLQVCGTVSVSGTGIISVNGAVGTSEAGGGSGGTIKVAAASLIGNGFIRANGGAAVGGGTNGGGGGGGGDVQLTLQDKPFTGTIEAKGGTKTAASAAAGVDATVQYPVSATGALCPEFGCAESQCAGSWEPLTGACDYAVSNSSACEDNNACTDTGTCQGGSCVGGPERGEPTIVGTIAEIVVLDATAGSRDLTANESDCQSGPAGNNNGLVWSVEEVDVALFSAMVDAISDVLVVTPIDVETAWTAPLVLVLRDPQGNETRASVTVRHDISDFRLDLTATPAGGSGEPVYADGLNEVALTATLRALTGLDVDHRAVTFSIVNGSPTGGRIVPTNTFTDATGAATVAFTPGTSVGTFTLRATALTATGIYTANVLVVVSLPPADLAIAPSDISFHIPGTGVRVFPGATNPTDPGATLEVRVKVHNRGGQASPVGLELALYDALVAGGATSSPRLVGVATLPAINARGVATVTLSATFDEAGFHVVSALADAGFLLDEPREDDNEATLAAEIGPPSIDDVIVVACALNERDAAAESIVVEARARMKIAGRADYRPFLPYDPAHALGISAVKGGVVSLAVTDSASQPVALGDAIPAIGDDTTYRALHTIGRWSGANKSPVGHFTNRSQEDAWAFSAPTTPGDYTLRACVSDGSFTGCCDAPFAVVPPAAELECTRPTLPGVEPGTAPTIGSATTLASTIANTGGSVASNVKVRLMVDGVSASEQTIASLAAGASTVVTFAWTPSCGEREVSIVVDPDNATSEAVETNNTCKRATPDIVADRVSLSNVADCRGEALLLAASGGGMPTASYATAYAGGPIGGATSTFSGTTVDVSSAIGNWTVSGTADGAGACGAVPEQNEASNNSASLSVCASPSPWRNKLGANYDGTIDLVVSPLPRRYGEATTVTARLYNYGNMTFAKTVGVKLVGDAGQDLDTDGDIKTVTNTCADGIEPGMFREVTWSWTPRYIAGNEVRGLRVIVDPTNTLGVNGSCRSDNRETTRSLSLDLSPTIAAPGPRWGVANTVTVQVVHAGSLAPNNEGSNARVALLRKNGNEVAGVDRAITTPIAGTPQVITWAWTPDSATCDATPAANGVTGLGSLQVTLDTNNVYAEASETNNIAFVNLPNLTPTGIAQRAAGCGSLFSFSVNENAPTPSLALSPWYATLTLTDPDGVAHGPYVGGPYTGIGDFDIGPNVDTLRAGTWGARIAVDTGTGSIGCGDIPERDESDNSLATTFTLCPDPTPIYGRAVEASGPAQFDHVTTLTSYVKNAGTTAISAPVMLRLGSDTVSTEDTATAAISCANPLLPGEVRVVTFQWTPRRDPRPRRLDVTIDPANTFVGECDETNNVHSRVLWLDLSPWKDARGMNAFGNIDLTATPGAIDWGTQLGLAYAIHDYPPVGDSSVLMLFPNGGGTATTVATRASGAIFPIDTALIASPSPSNPQAVTFSWSPDAGLCDPDDGLMTLAVEVDPTDFYDEDVETNNATQRNFPDLVVSEIGVGLVVASKVDLSFKASDGAGLSLGVGSWSGRATITPPVGAAVDVGLLGPFSGTGVHTLQDDFALTQNGTYTVTVDADVVGGACGEVPEQNERNNSLTDTFDVCPDAAVTIAPLATVVAGQPQTVVVHIENVGNQTLSEDVEVVLVGIDRAEDGEVVELPVTLDVTTQVVHFDLGNGLERNASATVSFVWTPRDDAAVNGLRAKIRVLDTRPDNGAYADADCSELNNQADVAFAFQWGCRIELSAGAWHACSDGGWDVKLKRPDSGVFVAAADIVSYSLRFEGDGGEFSPEVDVATLGSGNVDLPWSTTGAQVRLTASAILDDGSVCGATVERTVAPGPVDLFLFSDDIDFASKNGVSGFFNRAEVDDDLAIDVTLHNGETGCLAENISGVVNLNLGFEQLLLGSWTIDRIEPGGSAGISFVPNPLLAHPAGVQPDGFQWLVDDPSPWLDVFEVVMLASDNVDASINDDEASRALMVGELGGDSGACELVLAEPVAGGVIGAGGEETLRFRVHDLNGTALAPADLTKLVLFVSVAGEPPIPPKNLLNGGSTYEGDGVYAVTVAIGAEWIGTQAQISVVAECSGGICDDTAAAAIDHLCRCDDGNSCTFDHCDDSGACLNDAIPASDIGDATCDGVDDDCDGRFDEDYESLERGCSEPGLCSAAVGATRCDDGEEVVDCDDVWLGIDAVGDSAATCSEARVIVYLVVNDASGRPYGTVRCVRDAAGTADGAEAAIDCDTDEGDALHIYEDLLCPGSEVQR